MPTLKASTDFVVSVNPTGVVMWYVSSPAGQKHWTPTSNAMPNYFL